jgi:ABC-type transport system substrate-binding protein
MDKAAINETLFSGKGITSDSLIYPSLDYYPLVDKVVAKYPLDLKASEQLMNEAGFAKDAGGFYTQPGGGRINLEIRNIQSAQNDAERAIIADGWRHAGFEVEENVFTPVQTQDGQTLGTFRALSVTCAVAVREGLTLKDYTSDAVSRPETRWLGQNRGGWANTDYDRAAGAFYNTLDANGRHQAVADAIRILTTDLGLIPLHFNPGVLAYSKGITGPNVKSSDSDFTWNIYEWEYK